MRGVRSTHERRRRGLTVAVLALTASVLIPAALALACNPQAYLTIDRSSYAPGESVRVAGSFFRGDTDITVSVDRTGQSQTVKTTANGAFSTTFAMPQNAPTGGYSVQAIGYEANGDVIPGLLLAGRSPSRPQRRPLQSRATSSRRSRPASPPPRPLRPLLSRGAARGRAAGLAARAASDLPRAAGLQRARRAAEQGRAGQHGQHRDGEQARPERHGDFERAAGVRRFGGSGSQLHNGRAGPAGRGGGSGC